MSELPSFLKPRLRLFLSADIVGSTALKQSPRDRKVASAEWFAVIQGFYSEAQALFLGKWKQLAERDRNGALGPAPEFWKVIGDEITFVKILTDHKQASEVIKCWIEAVQELRQAVRSRAPRLDIKCTAWTAGFPIMNKEVVLTPSESQPGSVDHFKESGNLLNSKYEGGLTSDLVVDYIGPAIDIGFRLSFHATARKFVISVGVAYILSLTNAFITKSRRIGFDGAAPLKGVFGGAGYPIFWIDMAQEDDLAILEDDLTGRSSCERDRITNYCKRFFQENKTYTFPPFIESPTETEIGVRPDWYDEDLRFLAANYKMEVVADRESEKAAEQSSASEDAPDSAPLTSASLTQAIKSLLESLNQDPNIRSVKEK